MLKLREPRQDGGHACQPPSGGCVLKHDIQRASLPFPVPAAFGRLCVETGGGGGGSNGNGPAAFGRLCVETIMTLGATLDGIPAAFGRLCVETS